MGNCWGVRIKAVSPSHIVSTSGKLENWIKMESLILCFVVFVDCELKETIKVESFL